MFLLRETESEKGEIKLSSSGNTRGGARTALLGKKYSGNPELEFLVYVIFGAGIEYPPHPLALQFPIIIHYLHSQEDNDDRNSRTNRCENKDIVIRFTSARETVRISTPSPVTQAC